MLRLWQKNDPSTTQKRELRFSTGITVPIQLTQELPAISTPITIDGTKLFSPTKGPSNGPSSNPFPSSIFIDGSRIASTNRNAVVGFTSIVNGLTFAAGSGGSSLSNVTIGGFRQGAAILVDGVKAAVSNVTLGVDSKGARLVDNIGILVTASGQGSTDGTTIAGSRIYGSGDAGVSIRGTASGVSLTGNTIGGPLLDNLVGVSVTSTGANNSIGVVGAARNVIAYNYTGISLSGGSATVINSDVANNTFDGIQIAGGAQSIGTSAVGRGTASNLIFNNGRWGVNILSTATASAQKIVGNFFGRLSQRPTTADNKSGDVGVNNATAPAALGYVRDPKTGLDKQGNQHGDPAPGTGTQPTQPTTGPTSGTANKSKLPPWRTRR